MPRRLQPTRAPERGISDSIEKAALCACTGAARDRHQPTLEESVRGFRQHFDGVRDHGATAPPIVLKLESFNGGSPRARAQQVNLGTRRRPARQGRRDTRRPCIAFTTRASWQRALPHRNRRHRKARDAYRQHSTAAGSLLDRSIPKGALHGAPSYATPSNDMGTHTCAPTRRESPGRAARRPRQRRQSPGRQRSWSAGEDGPARAPCHVVEPAPGCVNKRAAVWHHSERLCRGVASPVPHRAGTEFAINGGSCGKPRWKRTELLPPFTSGPGSSASWMAQRRALGARGSDRLKVEDIQAADCGSRRNSSSRLPLRQFRRDNNTSHAADESQWLKSGMQT